MEEYSDDPLSDDELVSPTFTMRSFDQTTRVWNAENGRELLTLHGHGDAVVSTAWRPDGKRLATAGSDSLVQLYALDIHDLMALARLHITAHPSDEGCQKYLHVEKCPAVLAVAVW